MPDTTEQLASYVSQLIFCNPKRIKAERSDQDIIFTYSPLTPLGELSQETLINRINDFAPPIKGTSVQKLETSVTDTFIYTWRAKYTDVQARVKRHNPGFKLAAALAEQLAVKGIKGIEAVYYCLFADCLAGELHESPEFGFHRFSLVMKDASMKWSKLKSVQKSFCQLTLHDPDTTPVIVESKREGYAFIRFIPNLQKLQHFCGVTAIDVAWPLVEKTQLPLDAYEKTPEKQLADLQKQLKAIQNQIADLQKKMGGSTCTSQKGSIDSDNDNSSSDSEEELSTTEYYNRYSSNLMHMS